MVLVSGSGKQEEPGEDLCMGAAVSEVGWGLRPSRAGGFDEKGSRVLGPQPASQQDLLVSVILG